MDKALIEEGSFDLVRLFHLVSEEARKEKSAIPPINEMLYWWTRKPLVVSRAVVLTGTLRDIETTKYLLGINRDKRAFNYFPNTTTYNKALGRKASEINVLDPFGGAGNLIFEAKRLGLNCYACDYNPVAYLIMKSILEYPVKYSATLLDDIQKYGKELIERTKKEIGKLFDRSGKKSLTYLWVWCIKCPYCQQRVPLTNNMWILEKEKKRIGIRFKLTDDLNFKTELINNMHEKEGKEFTQKSGKAICIKCRNSIDYEHLSKDIANRRDREMIVTIVQGATGKDYELATEQDKQVNSEALTYLKQIWKFYQGQGLIPDEDIKANHRRESLLWHYGIKKWYQFYSERQLLVMLTLLKNIRELSKEISDIQYAKIIATT